MSNLKLSESIRIKLEENNMNPSDLERKAGLSSSVIRKILLGSSQNPTLETLDAISNVFDCTIDDLAGRVDKKPPHKENNLLLKDLIWSSELVKKIINSISSIIDKKNTCINMEDAITIIAEIYNYCVVKKDGKFDESFSEWYVNKKLN